MAETKHLDLGHGPKHPETPAPAAPEQGTTQQGATQQPASPAAEQTAGQPPADAPKRGVVVTEKAANEIKRVIAENGMPAHSALRVGAKGGGCSGFSYVLDIDQHGKTEFDLEFEQHGLKVLIDKKSEFYMGGTEIDFNDAELLNRGFVFRNPASSGSCGCGTSFSV
jgi:iron-sulfur cluster assembly protein